MKSLYIEVNYIFKSFDIRTLFGMDDNTISYSVLKILSKINKRELYNYYLGTYTSDKILTDIPLNLNKTFFIGIIVNTLSSTDQYNKVGHWIGITIHNNKRYGILTVRFFDSFGRKYNFNRNIGMFIEKLKKMADKNNKMFILDCIGKPIQKIYSKGSGIYCIFFIFKSWISKNKKSINIFFQDVIIKMVTGRF